MEFRKRCMALFIALAALLAIAPQTVFAAAWQHKCGRIAPPLTVNACPPRRSYARHLPPRLRAPPTFPSGGQIVEITGDECVWLWGCCVLLFAGRRRVVCVRPRSHHCALKPPLSN
jgi:hypothetical protein